MTHGEDFLFSFDPWGCSSVGRAPEWHSGGQGFDSPQLHHFLNSFIYNELLIQQKQIQFSLIPRMTIKSDGLFGGFFINLSRCVEMFLTEKRLGNLSNKTIDSYQYTIGKFVNYLESQDDDVDTTNLHPFVKPYLLHLQDSSKSPITYNTLLRGLGVFLRFLYTEGFVEKEIKLPKIKNIQSSIHPLTPDQIRKIFNSFDTSNFGGLRNKVIFSLMLDTGIRMFELSGLEMEDVDLNEAYMVVRGKGRKERYVPFGKSIRKLLWSYMKQRSKYSKEGVFLW